MQLRGQAGYAMAALLIAMSIMAIMMTVAMPAWKQSAQREKEAELVFRGEQYARAIGLFKRKFANASPPNIDTLVEQRFLRKKFKDPITNDDFVALTENAAAGGNPAGGRGGSTPAGGGQRGAGQPGIGPSGPSGPSGPGGSAVARPLGTSPIGTPGAGAAGGVIGVSSKSKEKSIRLYKGRGHYNEWVFVYTPPVQAPGAAVPGLVPGQRGQQPGPNRGSPFGPGPNGPGRGSSPFGPGRGPATPITPPFPTSPRGRGPGI